MTGEDIIAGLMARGIPYPAAVGIAGNLAVESGFDPGINEIAPVVPGSRGGYGLAQWTGPRRVQYEEYAAGRGLPVNSLDAQLDFLTWELHNTEKNAGNAILAADDPIEAARLVSERFLRPGIPHMDRRIEETRKLAGNAIGDASPASQPGVTPQAPQNALAPNENALNFGYRLPDGPIAKSFRNAVAMEIMPVNYLGGMS